MQEIRTQVHTIYMLIGPSGSGKSTFAKNVLIPQLSKPFDKSKNFKPNIQYISSDAIRQELLGINANKFDNIMTESSELAFKMFFTKLDIVSSYPINAEYIILDSTGLSETFRDQVLELANKNNYNVEAIVFDYKKVDEYKKNFNYETLRGTETSGRIISDHMSRLRTDVMKTLHKSKYKQVHKIKSKDFVIEENGVLTPTVKVVVWDYDNYTQRILPKKYNWVTIGDVHGCIAELKELICKYGFEINDENEIVDTEHTGNIGFIFIGDLVDKASDEELEETIRFIHINMGVMGERFQLVMGNHEEMVWKWVTNDPSLEITEARLEQKRKYYSTTFVLERNDELKNMFLEIYDSMKGWVKYIGLDKRGFVVTHAPCKIKYLEKMDGRSLSKQYKCTSRSQNPDKTNDELTHYLKDEAVNNQPMHIFGHMGQSTVRTFKNKVCIDSGCIYGHKLVGYSVNANKPFIKTVAFKGSVKKGNHFGNELFAEARAEKKTVRMHDLSETNQKRLNYISTHGIGYIGGTISPADKDMDTRELESLKAGLEYYSDKVEEVVLQPKYMGSRAQLYLNRDISKSYATSRNGYKIKTDLTEVFESQLKTHETLMGAFQIQELVMDGELMPWAALGDGLIESHFRVIDSAIKSEIDFLEDNGFDETFMTLVDKYNRSDFSIDKSSINKKELLNKYSYDYNNFKYVHDEVGRWVSLDTHRNAWKIYHEQVEIYGTNDEGVHFKPFRILKIAKLDEVGGEVIHTELSPYISFTHVSDDEVLKINFSDEDYLEKATEWYNKITTDEKMEGCVIKPNIKELPEWITPFLKVRNKNYLTLIYGYDMNFPKKFEKLLTQKNIKRKISKSIAEYKLGEKMLDCAIGSEELKQTVANFLFENEDERGIDPRL